MRRKVETATHSAGRGRSLISARTNQSQQRKMQGNKPRANELPRSYSSPSSHQTDREGSSTRTTQDNKGYVSRSFSTPDPKPDEYRRDSDYFYRPKCHGSREELDSDLENFEQFEECFIDMDQDQDQTMFGSYRHTPQREEPKRVVASLLPGSGLQRVPASRLMSAAPLKTFRSAKEAMMDQKGKGDSKGKSSYL